MTIQTGNQVVDNVIGNSVLAGALLFIVKWLLAHFDKREESRDKDRADFVTEMRAISQTLMAISAALQTNTREHEKIMQSLQAIHHEITKCVK